jgi:hypothetical protein
MKHKDQIDPLKPAPKPAQPHVKEETPEQRKEKVEAYLRLVKLDAAPSISFNPHDNPEVYAQAEAAVAAEKYSEILRNRKILGIGVAPEQVNVNEPPAVRKEREKDEKKPEGKVLTTSSFNK